MNPIPPPPPNAIVDRRGTAVRTLRDRCRALGVPTWRCAPGGLMLDEPSENGSLGLMLSSWVLSREISQAVANFERTGSGVITIAPGCHAVVLPEQRRRETIGVLVGLALGPEFLESELLGKACTAAALDAGALRRGLSQRARHTEASAQSLRDLLMWMAQDLAHAEENDETIGGFTRQLSDCFETIDLLYALGKSMNDLTHPGRFLKALCDRLRLTLGFGFVGARVTGLDRLDPELAGPVVSGRCGLVDLLDAELTEPSTGSDASYRVLSELRGRPLPGSGQLLVHSVLRSGRPIGAIFAGDKGGDDPQVSSYDIQLLEAAAGYLGAFIDTAMLYQEQRALFEGTLVSLTASIDAKDRYTCGHSQRVAHLAHALAVASGMSPEQADRVRIAGLVHDVGKIGVPESVLTKAGRLTDDEFAAIKRHPEIGHTILKDIPLLADVLPGVLHHHERYDGAGYPHGLSGDSIPLTARIIALADTFDAMSSTRSYRSALPRAAVLAEIRKCAGKQFDPSLAVQFVGLDFSGYDVLVAQHAAAAGPSPQSLAA